MREILGPYQDDVSDAVNELLDEIDQDDEICRKLHDDVRDLATAGKKVRGCLVLLAHDIYGGDNHDAARRVAATVEVVHTALLVHDDIMDRDGKRRGRDSLHTSYQERARQEDLDQPDHIGTGIAICAGDIGFFLGFRALSRLDIEPAVRQAVIERFADEFITVGQAQVCDLVIGASDREPDSEAIQELYKNKTARYTFSLPLTAGAILAGEEDDIDRLDTIGELLGTIYQLKDDELDLYGDEATIGKDQGSDLREGKKTLHRRYALQRMTPAEQERFHELLDGEIDQDDISEIIDLFEANSVREAVQKQMNTMNEQAAAAIKDLRIDKEDRGVLQALSRYCRSRDR